MKIVGIFLINNFEEFGEGEILENLTKLSKNTKMSRSTLKC